MNMFRINDLEKRSIATMLGMSAYDIELTPDAYTLRRYDLTSQLKVLANRDFEAYQRDVWAERAERYRQQTASQTFEVKALVEHFDGFRKWLKSGTATVPAEYAGYGSFQIRRDWHGTMKQEYMVMLPASAFGLAVVISLDTLIDLLRLLKSQKVNQIKVRAVPITPHLTANKSSHIQDVYHWSALEIQNGQDTYSLYSEARPEFELVAPFILYATPALPGGDAGCFPAAAARPSAIILYSAPIALCDLCHAVTQTTHVEEWQLCETCADRVSAYASRFEIRLERMRTRADKAHAAYQALNSQAHKMAEAIPFGQPILVGHHSEKADRRYRDRIHSTFGRAFAHFERAAKLRRRAAAAEDNKVISSDDPLAVIKLREKLADLESEQAHMKNVNAIIRKHAKAGQDAQVKALVAIGIAEASARQLLQPDFASRAGYPNYRLTNNNSEIRRVKARIEELLKKAQLAARMDTEAGQASNEQHGDIRLERDTEANRIRLHFPGKPAPDVIKALKHHGFVWSPSNTAWQRQLTNAGEYAAKCIIKRVNPMPQRFQPGQFVKVIPNERQPSLANLIGIIEYAQRYDNGDVEYRVKFPEFGEYVNDWELQATDE